MMLYFIGRLLAFVAVKRDSNTRRGIVKHKRRYNSMKKITVIVFLTLSVLFFNSTVDAASEREFNELRNMPPIQMPSQQEVKDIYKQHGLTQIEESVQVAEKIGGKSLSPLEVYLNVVQCEGGYLDASQVDPRYYIQMIDLRGTLIEELLQANPRAVELMKKQIL